MPSVTPFEPPTPSSKKRRRDDDLGEIQVPLYSLSSPLSGFFHTNSDSGFRTTQNESTNLLSAINNNERLIFPSSGRGATSLINTPRKVISLPVSKRFRLVNEIEEHPPHSHNGSAIDYSYSHAHPEYSTPPTSPEPIRPGTGTTKIANSAPSLSPCHICHRKPTKKSDLDSFADCQGCGQRACFICLRACRGWLPPSDGDDDLSTSFTMRDVDDISCETDSRDEELSQKQRKGGRPRESWSSQGHQELICSRCCVERGPEGDVVCLGCFAGLDGT